jgi:outer membrane protein
MNVLSKLIVSASIVIGGSCLAFSEGLSLDQAIREVCTKSDSVKMMKESIKKSEEMVREKWSNALPVISATGTTARNHGSAFGGSSSSGSATRTMGSVDGDNFSPSTEAMTTSTSPYVKWSDLNTMFSAFSQPQNSTIYSAGISINQPIFTFGKIGTAIKVAKDFNGSARYSYQRNMQTLQLLAIDAFYRTLLAQLAADISGRSLARKIELNQFLDRNFKLGSGSKAQVLATKADALSQGSITLIAQRDAQTARMYLNSFMGRPLIDSAQLDTTGIPGSLKNATLPNVNDAVREAKDSRSDLKALALLTESTRGGVKILKAMYYPSIGAIGSLGYSKVESGSSLFKINGMKNWTIGIGASWTLFDGFSYSAKAAQYASDANKLDIARNTVTQMVEIDIRSAIAEWIAADSNYNATQEMVGASRESYDLTISNFKQGSGQLADLQRADEMLLQSELGLANARYRQVRSRAALLVAMGKDIIKLEDR